VKESAAETYKKREVKNLKGSAFPADHDEGKGGDLTQSEGALINCRKRKIK